MSRELESGLPSAGGFGGGSSGRWLRTGSRIVVLPGGTEHVPPAGTAMRELDGEIYGDEWDAEVGRRFAARGSAARMRGAGPGFRRAPTRRRRPRHPRPRRRRPFSSRTVVLRDRLDADDGPERGTEFVRWVQSTLNNILDARLTVDGVMTPDTRRAVRAFQRRRGLPEDGIVGPDTERALIAARSARTRPRRST